MLQHLPNSLTLSRLLLAIPLGLLILREDFALALAIGLLAGLTDALDGFFARRLNAYSRFGAALDPIADKALIFVMFLCLAQIGLVHPYLAAAVIARDVIIIAGAAAYYRFIGPFEFAATWLSKANMGIQIAFCVLVLASQLISGVPAMATQIGAAIVLLVAAASGIDYVLSWTRKAIDSRKPIE